ncbi:MAG: hypothetical protein AB1486_18885 [Planctomycetota bacterium]
MLSTARRVLVLLAVLVILAPVLAGVILECHRSDLRGFHDGDYTVIELYTWRATEGKQLLGPYSRFCWHHPGPGYFYLLAPFYALSGNESYSLYIGAAVLNLAASVAVVAAIFHWLRSGAARALHLLGLGVYLSTIGRGPMVFGEIWNPPVTLLPFLAFCYLSAAWASGKMQWLPGVVSLGSLLIQTHVGYLSIVLPVLIVCLVLSWRHRPRDGGKGLRNALLLSLLALALFWFLPLLEELRPGPGNLSQVASSVLAGGGERDWREAADAASLHLTHPVRIFLGAASYGAFVHCDTPSLRLLIAAAQLVLLVWALWRYRSMRSCYQAALCVVAITGHIMAYLYTLRLPGPLFPYLMWWMEVPGALSWPLVLAAARARSDAPLGRWLGRILIGAGVIVVVFLTARQVTRSFDAYMHGEEQFAGRGASRVHTFLDALQQYLVENAIERPLLASAGRSAEMAGVVLQLAKRGVPIVIREDLAHIFGDGFDYAETAPVEVWFGYDVPPGAQVITREQDVIMAAVLH